MKGKKLGTLLVEAGLISPLQIDQALQAQQIFGGRLGTNLVEMGILDMETLAGFLSQQLGIPRCSLGELENIPSDILHMIPPIAAQRLGIIPLAREGQVLSIAIQDMLDERVIKRLESNVGLTISPKIATEVEIRFYLEKYYGIPREMRHIQVMNQIQSKVKEITPPHPILDEQMPTPKAIEFFFKEIKDLQKVPVRLDSQDLKAFNLSPELAYLLMRVDNFSTLADFFSVSPMSRMITLRSLAYLCKVGLIRFEENV